MSSASDVSPVEEVATFLARRPSAHDLGTFRFSNAALKRADELMDKSKAGTLTSEEERELDRFILLDDMIAIIKLQISDVDTAEA